MLDIWKYRLQFRLSDQASFDSYSLGLINLNQYWYGTNQPNFNPDSQTRRRRLSDLLTNGEPAFTIIR